MHQLPGGNGYGGGNGHGFGGGNGYGNGRGDGYGDGYGRGYGHGHGREVAFSGAQLWVRLVASELTRKGEGCTS